MHELAFAPGQTSIVQSEIMINEYYDEKHHCIERVSTTASI
jgi:hypothetical protein